MQTIYMFLSVLFSVLGVLTTPINVPLKLIAIAIIIASSVVFYHKVIAPYPERLPWESVKNFMGFGFSVQDKHFVRAVTYRDGDIYRRHVHYIQFTATNNSRNRTLYGARAYLKLGNQVDWTPLEIQAYSPPGQFDQGVEDHRTEAVDIPSRGSFSVHYSLVGRDEDSINGIHIPRFLRFYTPMTIKLVWQKGVKEFKYSHRELKEILREPYMEDMHITIQQ